MIALATDTEAAAASLQRAVAAFAAHDLPLAAAEVSAARQAFVRSGGVDHPDVAHCLVLSSRIALAQRRWKTAREDAREAVAIASRWLAAADDDDAILRLSLQAAATFAEVALASGEVEEGLPILAEALQRAERRLPASAQGELAPGFNLLGVLLKTSGRFTAAGEAYARAHRLADPRNLALSAALQHNRAGLLHAQGDFLNAEAEARGALAVQIEAHGPEHPVVAAERAALAAILVGRAALEEAEQQYLLALDGWGSDHPDEAALVLSALGALHATAGAWDEARRVCELALALGEKTFGLDHLEVGRTCQYLAVIHRELGQPDLARRYVARALDILAPRLPSFHPLLIDARSTADSVEPGPN
jgi:tetratricopeptide (TPR) repeat protein